MIKCKTYMGKKDRIWWMRNPDHLVDGEIVEGAEMAVWSALVCHRWRWHRGEHRA